MAKDLRNNGNNVFRDNNIKLAEDRGSKENTNLHLHSKRAGETYSFDADGFGHQVINGTLADGTSSLTIGGVKLEGSAYPVTYSNGTIIANRFVLAQDAPPAYLLETSGTDLKISLTNTPAPVDQLTIQNFADGGFGIRRLPESTNLRGGEEFQVNTYTTSDQIDPSISGLTGGGFVIAWQSLLQDGSQWGIFAQLYDASGIPSGVEFQANTNSSSDQRFPSTAGLTDGGFVITWQSRNQDGGGYGVYAQQYNSSGGTSGVEFRVNSFTTNDQGTPSAAGLADGGFAITWTSWNGQDGSGNGIYAQKYDAAGSSVGGELQVNTITFGGQNNSLVSGLDDGGFIIAWEGNDAAGSGIFAQRYNASGSRSGGEFQVNTHTDNTQSELSVAGLVGGGFVITWQSNLQDGSAEGVYAQMYDAGGSPYRTEFQVNTSITGAQRYPSVAGLVDGGFVITWQGQDNQSEGVYIQQYDASGNPSNAEFLVNTHEINDQFAASVASLSNGAFVVTWQSNLQDGSNHGIYARAFSAGYERVLIGTDESETLDCMDVSSCMLVSMGGDDTLIAGGHAKALLIGDGSGAKQFEVVSQDETYNVYEISIKGFKNGDTLDLRSLCLDDQLVVQTNNGTRTDITLPTGKVVTIEANDASDKDIRISRDFSFNDNFGQQIVNNSCPNGQLLIDGVKLAGNAFPVTHNNGTVIDNKFVLVKDAPPAYLLETSGTDLKISLTNTPAPANQIIIPNFEDGDFGISTLLDNSNLRGGEFQVNTYTADAQLSPSIAALDNGGFVVAWNSLYQDGSQEGIYAQLYDAVGVRSGEEFQVNTYIIGSQTSPSVAGLRGGGFVIAWTSNLQDGSGDGIYSQQYNAVGDIYNFEFLVNTYTTNYQFTSAVTGVSDGGFVVVWQSSLQDGDGMGIYAQRYDSSGNRSGLEFRVNTYTTLSQSDAAVASLTNGGFVIVWESAGQDGSSQGVYAQQYAADGNADGAEFQVNTYTADAQSDTSVTGLDNGGFVVAWQSNLQDSSEKGIYAQRYDEVGTALGVEFQVNTYTTSFQARPLVASLNNGGFVIVWDSEGQDGDLTGVYAQRYNAIGDTISTEFQVNTYTIDKQIAASAVGLVGGGFVITWQSKGQDGSTEGIYARIYNAGYGTVIVGTDLSETLDCSDAQSCTLVAMKGDDILRVDAHVEALLIGDASGTKQFEVVSQDGTYNSNEISIKGFKNGDALDLSSLCFDDQLLTQTHNGTRTDITLPAGKVITIEASDASAKDIKVTREPIELVGSFGQQLVDKSCPNDRLSIDGVKLEGNAFPLTYNNGTVIANKFLLLKDLPPYYLLETSGSDLKISHTNTSTANQFTIKNFDDADFGITRLLDRESLTEGKEFQVNTYEISAQRDASVSSLSGGGFVIAWESNQDVGGGMGIYAQRYAVDYVPFGSEFRVNTYTTNNQERPSVAGLSDGGFIIAWESMDQDSSQEGIFAQRYDSSGNISGTEFQVNTYVLSTQSFPAVASLVEGGFVITWKSVNQDMGDGRYGVYAQRYDVSGSPSGVEFLVNTHIDNNQRNPSVTGLVDGGFIIVWESNHLDLNSYEIYAQCYSSDGSRSGLEFQVNTYTINHQLSSSVAATSDGGFIIAWESNLQDGNDVGIFAQRYDANSLPKGIEFQVNTYTIGRQAAPSIAVMENGDFVITWDSAGGQDGDEGGIYAQRYDANGATIGLEFQVNDFTTNNQLGSSVDAISNGNFIVAWTSQVQDFSGEGVYAKLYDTALSSNYKTVIIGTDSSETIDCGDASGCLFLSMKGDDILRVGAYAEALLIGDASGTKQFEVVSKDGSYNSNGISIKGFKNGDTLDLTSLCFDEKLMMQTNNATRTDIALPGGKSITIEATDNAAEDIVVGREFRFEGEFGRQFINNSCPYDQIFIDGYRVLGNATLISNSTGTNEYILFGGDTPLGFSLSTLLEGLKVSLFGESNPTNELILPNFDSTADSFAISLSNTVNENVLIGQDGSEDVLSCEGKLSCIAVASVGGSDTLVADTASPLTTLVGNPKNINTVFQIRKDDTSSIKSLIEIRGYKVGDKIDLSDYGIDDIQDARITVTDGQIRIHLTDESKALVFILPPDGDSELSIENGHMVFNIIASSDGGTNDSTNSDSGSEDDSSSDGDSSSGNSTLLFALIGLGVSVFFGAIGYRLKHKHHNEVLEGIKAAVKDAYDSAPVPTPADSGDELFQTQIVAGDGAVDYGDDAML
jgi:large repetitive protein